MKAITESSEKLLIKSLQAMNLVELRGKENMIRMVNTMDAIQEVLKQINTPPKETGEDNKKEE